MDPHPNVPKILLVEDEPEVQEYLKNLLMVNGCKVYVAGDGKLGLAVLDDVRIRGETIDGILLDLRMPIMDGEQFLKAIVEKNLTTPVIILSAYLGEFQPWRFPNVKKVIQKPPDVEELKKAVLELRDEKAK